MVAMYIFRKKRKERKKEYYGPVIVILPLLIIIFSFLEVVSVQAANLLTLAKLSSDRKTHY